jgi:hypothetical protein
VREDNGRMPALDPVHLAVWLCSPDGGAVVASASRVLADHHGDLLSAGTAIRRAHPDLAPDLATAAVEQATLRILARERYGMDASRLLLTRDGLEQATRPEVAATRAELLTRAGARTVVDLTAGLGFDAAAFRDAGLHVIAVERDPATAALCGHNVPEAEVILGDATDPVILRAVLAGLAPDDVVFLDPARRTAHGPRELGTARIRPERDPERWSPPWSFAAGIAHPRVAAKTAPSFEPPEGWVARWTSLDRTVLECACFSWPVLGARRQAVVLDANGHRTLDATDAPLAIATDIGTWLLEPDPAITRARATSALLVHQPDLTSVDPESSWLTCDSVPGPSLAGLVRAYRVVTELTGSRRQQRDQLRGLGINAVAVKSRDVRMDPRQVRIDLGCREGTGTSVILTRRRGRTVSVLAEPAPVPRD